MKKVISLLLSVAMILSFVTVPAMAADPASVTANANYTTKIIEVVYNNTANYDCYVTIYMVDVDECNKAVFDYQNHDFVRTATVEADANSEAKVEFVFGSDIKTGDYNFYAAPSGKNGTDYYAKTSKPLSLLGETADEGDVTIGDVIETINNASQNTISTIIYAKLRDVLELQSNPSWRKTYLYEIKMTDYSGAFATITDIDEAIKVADALNAVRSASPDTLAKVVADGTDVLALDTENADYKNEAYQPLILEAYAAKLVANDVKSRTANAAAFDEAIAFTVFNRGSAAEKANAFTKYQKSLGISDELLKLITDKGTEVVARHLEGFTAADKTAVVTKITGILAAISNEPSNDFSNDSSGSSRPSGNGGSVGGGITIPNNVIVPDPVVVPTPSSVFTDVPSNHWANKPVEYLANAGVVSGKGDGKFAPDSTVTREEFVKMIVGAFGIEANGGVIDFADVPASHWAYEYIRTAYANDIVKGISWDKFGVGSPITRQDMAVILMRIVDAKGINLTGNASSFMDDADIASYAKESVMELVAGGIINGYNDGTFKPHGSLTRAEAAKVIYALINR